MFGSLVEIFFGLGETNAGKSTIVIAGINTFGDYIGTFNGENLCIKSCLHWLQFANVFWVNFHAQIIFAEFIKQNLLHTILDRVAGAG